MEAYGWPSSYEVWSKSLQPFCLAVTCEQTDVLTYTHTNSTPRIPSAVTFGTAKMGLGGLAARPVPSSLYQM